MSGAGAIAAAIERGDARGLAVRLGFWAALATALTAAVALAIAMTTAPRSGPYFDGGCIGAPYTNAAAFVPRDYLWMYPAALLTLLLIVLVACLAERVDARRRVLGRNRFHVQLSSITPWVFLPLVFVQYLLISSPK